MRPGRRLTGRMRCVALRVFERLIARLWIRGVRVSMDVQHQIILVMIWCFMSDAACLWPLRSR